MKKKTFLFSLLIVLAVSCTVNKRKEDQLSLFVMINLPYDKIPISVILGDSILYDGFFISGYKGRIDTEMFIADIDKEYAFERKLTVSVKDRDTTFVYSDYKIDSLAVIYFFGNDKFLLTDNLKPSYRIID